MTDSLKAAHEAIDDITAYHGRQKAHAALDAAVEEAVRTTKDTERAAAERSVMLALSAERERGRREAFGEAWEIHARTDLHRNGDCFDSDAGTCEESAALESKALLQSPPAAEEPFPCPDCGLSSSVPALDCVSKHLHRKARP